jgi:hypothetical protein
MKVNPWMKCECGKIHVSTFIRQDTLCKCGARLYPQIPVRSTNARGGLD